MSRLRYTLVTVVAFSVFMPAMPAAATPDTDSKAGPTHKQLRTIKPKHDGRDLTLLTFCLSPSRDLWVSVSSEPRYAQLGAALKDNKFQGIQVYDTDGQLKSEHALKFDATAINFGPDGTLFAAGQGKLARLSPMGDVQLEAPAPNIGDMEEFKKKVVEAAKAEYKKNAEQYRKQAETYARQIEAAEKKKPDERSEQEQAQLETWKQQHQQFEQIAEQFADQNLDPASTVLSRLAIPGIAVTADHVFVVLQSDSGRGYEVWRTNHDLSDGKMVCEGLSGCCGNMDVQARESGFATCENSRFQVVSHDSEGKRLASFGKRDRSKPEGFGSCCNPMNCLSLANGDYVVAESSIGNIKRFDGKGNFQGIVGKARISGNCKHVSLGFDEQRDRYYMMNQDKNHICVLVPKAEAPALTEEERQASEAKAGLGKKLIGHWQLEKPAAKIAPKKGVLARLFGNGGEQDLNVDAEFLADGSAKIKGGNFELFKGMELSWECERQADKKLYIGLYLDGVEFITTAVTFADDDHVQFGGTPYFPAEKTFVRTTAEPGAPAVEKTAKAAKENVAEAPLEDDDAQ